MLNERMMLLARPSWLSRIWPLPRGMQPGENYSETSKLLIPLAAGCGKAKSVGECTSISV